MQVLIDYADVPRMFFLLSARLTRQKGRDVYYQVHLIANLLVREHCHTRLEYEKVSLQYLATLGSLATFCCCCFYFGMSTALELDATQRWDLFCVSVVTR